MIVESLLGGLFGGLLRLAPEVLKFFDKKNEREHELKMFEREIELSRVRGEVEMHRSDNAVSVAELDAMAEAFKEQSATAKAGGKFVSAVSALVRPVVTYWFTILYSIVKLSTLWLAYQSGISPEGLLSMAWTEQDWSIFAMILSFWFVGRVWERLRK